MAERSPVIYGLEFQGRSLTARTLASRAGETDRIHFLCGTQSLHHDNQVHLLDYNEDIGVLDKTVFMHPAGEIWHLSSCPADRDLLCTCYGVVEEGRGRMAAALWRLGQEGEDHTPLVEAGALTHEGNVRCTVWHPGSQMQLVSVDDKQLTLWKLAGGGAKAHGSMELEGRGRVGYSALCWSPHHNCSQILCGCETVVKAWDSRTNSFSFTLEQPHGPCVRGMDYNPNKPYHFASCGDDCTVKFWDCRKLDTPLIVRQDHSHWIWSVQYNLFHDQLVLTASSDSQVVLTRMVSIASEPLRHIEEDENGPPAPQKDEVIQRYEEHEDSVYTAVWSTADAWVFASLSYDGRLVINHVPNQEKFAILTS